MTSSAVACVIGLAVSAAGGYKCRMCPSGITTLLSEVEPD